MTDFRINIDGIESVLQNVDRLLQKVAGVGNGPISLRELFPLIFLTRYTDFMSFEDMAQKSGFKLETEEDLASIPQDKMDAFIATHTQFSSWEEMLFKGYEEWTQRELGLS